MSIYIIAGAWAVAAFAVVMLMHGANVKEKTPIPRFPKIFTRRTRA